MQENFIEELENRSHKNIDERKVKINTLLEESDEYVKENVLTQKQVDKLTKEQEEVTGATEKLRDLGGLKGKISNKVSTITKEHKFFSDNTVCPTCTQPIEEDSE